MQNKEIIIKSEKEMVDLGVQLAQTLKAGDCLAFHGQMGAGKSFLIRAMIRSVLGTITEVPSPTFTLVQTYDFPGATLYHYDLYRLNDPEEVLALDWEDAQQGIMLIEWPDKAGPYLPNDARHVYIEKMPESETARKVIIKDQKT